MPKRSKKKNKKKKYIKNWKAYNLAQTVQLPLFLYFVKVFVRNLEVEDRWRGDGRPPLPTKDALKCLLLLEYFQNSARKSVAKIQTYKDTVEIKNIPHFNTLLNLRKDPYLMELTDQLTMQIFKTINHEEKEVTTDSTGEGTSNKKFWRDKKNYKKKRKDFVKDHFTFGRKTLMIAAHTTTKSYGKGTGDSTQLIVHTEKMKNKGITYEKHGGDGAYCTRKCATAIKNVGATPIIKIKKNATAKKKGSAAFRDMVKSSREHPRIYKRTYNYMRPKIESGIYSFKSTFSHKVRSKLFEAQDGESSARCAVYNMLKLPHAIFEFGITPQIA
jgi:hypothetical protein